VAAGPLTLASEHLQLDTDWTLISYSCRRELLDRTLIWNQRHLMTVLREYEDFYNTHRPHRTLNQAAPLRPLPDGITDLDHFRVLRRDRAGGVIHEYHLVA
jgi:putative transposase